MNLRNVLIACVLLGVLAWWYSLRSSDQAEAPVNASAASGCPLPPGVRTGEAPLQTEIPGALGPFRHAAASLDPLAGFSIEARVLSREDYRMGREADLSPTDLALGWERMRDEAVVSQLKITQSSRWYHYRWQNQPPLPPAEIARSSANMHMIPSSDGVAEALAQVDKDDNVRIEGWLVEARAPDGWRWRSSTSREDTGGGVCEVVYVCQVTRL